MPQCVLKKLTLLCNRCNSYSLEHWPLDLLLDCIIIYFKVTAINNVWFDSALNNASGPSINYVTLEGSGPRRCDSLWQGSRSCDVTHIHTYEIWNWKCCLTFWCDGCFLIEDATSRPIINYNATWNFKSQLTFVTWKFNIFTPFYFKIFTTESIKHQNVSHNFQCSQFSQLFRFLFYYLIHHILDAKHLAAMVKN